MAGMIAGLNASFSALHPAVRLLVDLPATRAGPPALANGRASIAPMGAMFTPAQLASYRELRGSDPAGFRVAHASLNPKALSGPNAVFVHRDNPLAAIDSPALARLFTGQGPRQWGDLGVGGTMTQAAIQLAGLASQTPLALEFQHALFPGRSFAPDIASFHQSSDVIDFVASEPLALGFAALNRANDAVRALGLRRSPDSPAIFASEATLRSGAYLLDRHLWLYARREQAGHLEPLPRSYIAFALSRRGQAIIGSGPLGYLALGEKERERELARLR